MSLKEKEITVPILLVIYNRPEITKKSIDAIARVSPKTLLVAADGPKSSEDSRRCKLTRDLIDAVDWTTDVRRNYSNYNLGCGVRVSSAVDWALDKFEEVIVLEDDCIATPSFFSYCQNLLDRFRNDSRVMHISGNNFLERPLREGHSYYFSKYTHAWGWATWRRAWRYFDWKMEHWPECRDAEIVKTWCDDPYERQYWLKIFEDVYGGHRDAWDYQWNFACWSQNGLAVLPSVNLVSNIGFGPDATHTKLQSPYLERSTEELNLLKHPPCIFRNLEADAFTFERNFGGAAMRYSDSWQAKCRSALHSVLLPYRALRKVYRKIPALLVNTSHQ